MEQALWLVAVISLAIAGLCAAVIILDEAAGHRQHMWIMNVVWPVTALYAGPLALWAYFRAGRLSTAAAVQQAKARGEDPPGRRKPFWQMVALGATHCGAGCTLADIIGESLTGLLPFTILGSEIAGAWALDFALAYSLGIVFQYFTIKPMRGLSVGAGLWAALKADTLSLIAWQVGMYGGMAVLLFALLGHELPKSSPVFWFFMQLAMLAGFCTSYPINWWLLRSGLKEKM